jgi:hypothetical protein
MSFSRIPQLFSPHRPAPRSKSIKGCSAGWLHVDHMLRPHVFIIALQDIAASTEMTIDYGEGTRRCPAPFGPTLRFFLICFSEFA